MNKPLKRLLPLLLILVIIASVAWYLFIYDRAFTQDFLLQQARYFDDRGDHTTAAWIYDLTYRYSGGDEAVAIELSQLFKEYGNYTKAEATLANAIADGGTAELYIALCKTYIEQDKLLDAVTMLDNITDPAVRQQIDALRPAKPAATPAPDYYSQYINVTFDTPEGALYLTTDGSYPTVANPFTGELTLEAGETVIKALAMNDLGLVSPLGVYGYTVSGVIEVVTLTDPQMDAAVRKALGVEADTQIFSNDLWNVLTLELPEGAASYKELSRIPYLQSLTITGSQTASLEGLGSLSNLTELVIRDSYLKTSDLQLIASLPNLKKLTLSNCGLSGIQALAGAKGLTYLDLSDNSIGDFTALSSMTALQHLDLSHNALTDLSAITSLPTLQWLDVSYNSLTTIEAVAACSGLTYLDLSYNTVPVLTGVENMRNLSVLKAASNGLSDISPVSGLTKLTELDVSDNLLTDITCLSPLNALEHLLFPRNQVTALPAWSKECRLVTLDATNNLLTNVDVLSGFEQLNYVLADYNQITNIDSLRFCRNLVKVSVFENPITDVSLVTDVGIIVIHNPLN